MHLFLRWTYLKLHPFIVLASGEWISLNLSMHIYENEPFSKCVATKYIKTHYIKLHLFMNLHLNCTVLKNSNFAFKFAYKFAYKSSWRSVLLPWQWVIFSSENEDSQLSLQAEFWIIRWFISRSCSGPYRYKNLSPKNFISHRKLLIGLK